MFKNIGSLLSLFRTIAIFLSMIALFQGWIMLTAGPSPDRLWSFGISLFGAVIYWLSYRLLSQKKAVVILVFGIEVVFTAVVILFFGAGQNLLAIWLNILGLLVGLAALAYLWNLKKKGELA